MKPPEEYAMLAEQPSTYNELRDLFAACQREAIEEAAERLDQRSDELLGHTVASLSKMREATRDEAIYCSELVRALLTPATPPRQDEAKDA